MRFSSARGTKSRTVSVASASEVDRLRCARLLLVLGARHRQQLVDHVRGALARAGDLLQRLLQRLRVALAGVDLALRQLGLRAQPGQRRLQLVRGVGEEVLLRADRLVQPRQQVVDRAHQRRHLLGRLALVDRRSGRRLSRWRMRCCSSFSGAMPRASANHTSSTASGRITNCGRITPLMISVARRERLPSVSATCTSGRGGRRPRAGQRHPQVGHAHRLVAASRRRESAPRPAAPRSSSGGTGSAAFAAQRTRRAGRAPGSRCRRPRRCAAARRRRVGQREPRAAARRSAPGCARDLLRQHARHLAELAVEGPVGDALRHQPGQRHAHRPQQQQRREHPVEDLAEQRALFAGGAGIGAVRRPRERLRAGRARRATRSGRRSSPGSSRARARWRCAPAPARSSCAGGGCRPRSRCC